jgi:hypothetical protein
MYTSQNKKSQAFGTIVTATQFLPNAPYSGTCQYNDLKPALLNRFQDESQQTNLQNSLGKGIQTKGVKRYRK